MSSIYGNSCLILMFFMTQNVFSWPSGNWWSLFRINLRDSYTYVGWLSTCILCQTWDCPRNHTSSSQKEEEEEEEEKVGSGGGGDDIATRRKRTRSQLHQYFSIIFISSSSVVFAYLLFYYHCDYYYYNNNNSTTTHIFVVGTTVNNNDISINMNRERWCWYRVCKQLKSNYGLL